MSAIPEKIESNRRPGKDKDATDLLVSKGSSKRSSPSRLSYQDELPGDFSAPHSRNLSRQAE
jgi:hypothetical protein